MNAHQRRIKRRKRQRFLKSLDEASLAHALKYRTYVPSMAAMAYGWEELLRKEGYELDGLRWRYPTPTVPQNSWFNHYAGWPAWRSYWRFVETYMSVGCYEIRVLNGDTSVILAKKGVFGE